MKNLIIIPTYNEKGHAYKIIKKIEEVLKNRTDYSILIVDDNSTDGTKEEIARAKKDFRNILLLEREGKLGLASAYIEGIKKGLKEGFENFIEMDADFSHDPKYLPEMLKNLEEFDLSIGSRNIKGGSVKNWGFLRNLISKGGSLYSQIILNCPIKDLTGGFNGWNKKIIEKMDLNSIISKGYSFQIEMKYKAFKNGAKYKEFPIIFEDRKIGNSKMSKKIFLEALLNVIKIRLKKS